MPGYATTQTRRGLPIRIGTGASLLLIACASSAEPTRSAIPDRPAADPPSAMIVERSEPEDTQPEPQPEPPGWLAPLPTLSLEPLNSEQQRQVKACIPQDRLQADDLRAEELEAAARCVEAVPHPGFHVRLLTLVLTKFPRSPEARTATRKLGARYEQLQQPDRAITTYTHYLKIYPSDADARELGQRAVCLAHSLQMSQQTEDLLDALSQTAGPRFVRPDAATLDRLCTPSPG